MNFDNLIVKRYDASKFVVHCTYCKENGKSFAAKIDSGSPIIWTKTKRSDGLRDKGKGRSYHPACWAQYCTDLGVMSPIPVEESGSLGDAKEDENEMEDMQGIRDTMAEMGIPETNSNDTPLVSSDNNDLVKVLTDVLLKPLHTRLAKLESGNVSEKLDSAIADGRKKMDQQVEALKAIAANIVSEETLVRLIQQHTTKRIEVYHPETQETTDLGVCHEQFEDLLQIASARLPDGYRPNVMLVGAAGTGKTKAADQLSKALKIPFHFTGAIAEPYSLLGFKNVHGEYQRTPFREAYEHGGTFLFDEMDSSEPLAVMPFNAALANGHCAFPDGVVTRHKDNLIIAATNTYGHGATNQYVGRCKFDGAFLDRFIKFTWNIDEKLEASLCANDAWLARVRSVRANVASKGLMVLVTPRASIYGASLLAAGIPMKTVETLCLRNGMTKEQWDSVK